MFSPDENTKIPHSYDYRVSFREASLNLCKREMESWLRSCLLDKIQNNQIQRMRLIFRFLGQHLPIIVYLRNCTCALHTEALSEVAYLAALSSSFTDNFHRDNHDER